ncbi:hypothetical protein TRIUR3_29876 [Triticum urartu]|uniref:Uncharacterized protein n=1 Tax=Triticum urartu TaxID=4572 RepID=M7YLC0_TRIUA|nr:hypothetical protein TRIUR3_29876 [Triticum urartu]
MSRIFAPSGVGLANAVAAGWANVGSAAAQVVMPLAYDLIVLRLGVPITVAWRVAYLIPCAMLITTGLAVLAFPYDLPSGCAYAGGGKGAKGEGFWKVVRGGVCDYRAWVLALTYGYCYGVELIMENVAGDLFPRRSMGVVSGMTASGGAVGAIVTNRLFFSSSSYTVEEAISFTGLTSLLCTLPVVLIYFPRSGGMLCGPSETDIVGHDRHGDDDANKDDDYMLLK